MFFDPLYLILLMPGLLIALWASFKVKSAFAKYSRIGARSGLSGSDVARIILDRNGLSDVSIETIPGTMSDHYDPRTRTLRLSAQVSRSPSLASQGIAAHEAGHALQHKIGYAPLQLRSFLVPVASVGSNFGWILITIGIMLAYFGSGNGLFLAKVGLILFSAAVAFTLVTLPVEFNASARAKSLLVDYGLVAPDEIGAVSAVLNAAALTYVAAAVTAILQLLYWLIRLGILGGRRD
jgi:uncharacterized protein